ncbi:MAG TPA: DoxX family protein [Myxococcota bacterium]|nr:DoxX family protein [Myxococcota bacterium]
MARRLLVVSPYKRASLYGMSAFYLAAGAGHFLAPGFYLPMMPASLPWHLGLIYVSGGAEMALGAALLVPPFRRMAAWGLIALLIAVFPANLHVALHNIPIGGRSEGLGLWNWVRLPLQGLLILWAWWYTRPQSVTTPETLPG